MNGRAYDYNLGRFLSVDPIIQSPGNSQSINPYSYIMNNPLAGTDPTGYCAAETGTRIKKCVDVDVTNTDTGETSTKSVNVMHSNAGSHIISHVASSLGNGAQVTGISATFANGKTTDLMAQSNNTAQTSDSSAGAIAIPASGAGIGQISMATLGRAVLGIFSALTLSGDTPQENKEEITVFRGTTFTDEHQVHEETGLLMSEAARRAYNEEMYRSGDTGKALIAASRENLIRHSELLRKYGGETGLAVAQSDGSFTGREYPRSMFSVTTNESVARHFASGPGGKVYSATIPKGMLVRQPLSSSNESEYFVRGMWKFEELK